MFGWGIYDFFAGVYARKIGPFKTFFWSQLSGLVFVLFLIAVFTLSRHLHVRELILLPIAALCYSIGYLLFMKGFAIGNISIVAAIMNLWAVFTMLIAYAFMGQRLSTLQFIGVLMIIGGTASAALNWRDIQNRSFALSAGVKETVIGAFFFGVFWNISEIISEEIGWLSTTLGVKFGIIVILLMVSFLAKRELSLTRADVKTKSVVALMGVLDAGAVAVVNFGLTVGDAILITPIASALSVVTITMALVFLKDRITLPQGLGIATAVLGIIITGL
ncbi:MAG: DMT family transporter [Deltaproteobacteria bacterium]|jgi:transporter family protein|nr:DMT family transporter [Deltaproteobacteria bacterium]